MVFWKGNRYWMLSKHKKPKRQPKQRTELWKTDSQSRGRGLGLGGMRMVESICGHKPWSTRDEYKAHTLRDKDVIELGVKETQSTWGQAR